MDDIIKFINNYITEKNYNNYFSNVRAGGSEFIYNNILIDLSINYSDNANKLVNKDTNILSVSHLGNKTYNFRFLKGQHSEITSALYFIYNTK